MKLCFSMVEPGISSGRDRVWESQRDPFWNSVESRA